MLKAGQIILHHGVRHDAVIGGAYRSGEKGAIVAGIVPREGTVVAGVLPEPNREFDRLDRPGAVQHDRLAVGFDLLATP